MTTTTIFRTTAAGRMARPLVLFLLLLLQAQVVLADDARIKLHEGENEASVSINMTKVTTAFDLYLYEKDGDPSYWRDNPGIYLDDVLLCNLSDLGLPVLTKWFSSQDHTYYDDYNKLANELEKLRPVEGIVKTKVYNSLVSVSAHDPRYVKESKEYWVTIYINLGYNVEGEGHRIEVRGTWADNKNKQYSGKKALGFSTTKYNTNRALASAGSATRENGKIVWKAQSMQQVPDYHYAFSLQKSNDHKRSFDDADVERYAYWNAEPNATESQQAFEADNWTPYTVYPRVILTSNTTRPYYGGQGNQTFRKDYAAVIVPGFPRPKRVAASTADAYAKKVKLTWDVDIKDKDHVNTSGKWFVFRKQKGDADSAYTKVGETSYSTRSFTDRGDSLKYYEANTSDNTQYVYTVCFVPNGWTVEKPDDARSLSAGTEYKLTRTFSISDLKVTESKTGVDLEWNISPITDASSSHTYELKIERSSDGETWSELSKVTIDNKSKTSGTYTDSQGLKAFENHFYRASINVQGRDYSSNSVSAGLAGGTSVTNFTATRGTLSKSVKLQWSVDQVGAEETYYRLLRRPLDSSDEDEWLEVTTTHGTATLYSYEDAVNPGSYYKYHLQMWINRADSATGAAMQVGIRDYYTDGFGLATGVFSGRIYYGSGTAVEGVKISLRPSEANGETLSNFRSLKMENAGGTGIRYQAAKGKLQQLAGNDYTVQMYLAPDSGAMAGNAQYTLFDMMGGPKLKLSYNAANTDYTLWADSQATNLRLPAGLWSHLSMVKSGSRLTFYLNGLDSAQTATTAFGNKKVTENDTLLALGNSVALNDTAHFIGFVDEFRLFKKALTENDILQNYAHTLAGSEEGLAIYWPMDEGIASQTLVYDYSKTGDSSNGRIGQLAVAAESNTYVPDNDQLSLSAYTDKNGNFMVRGIPFSGEGTNYIATPTLGVHQFSPSTANCYISLNSLVFSGKDFTDVSSFPVSGRVRYEGTTIPVKDAYLKVDGIIASRDGELIMTDQDGNYTVDVPIGDHFIQVEKSGHVFANGGRYPADPDSLRLRHTFERAFSNVDFFDATTVTVAGRVSGGKTENAKALIVGGSVANIGQGVITLDFKDDENRAEYIHAKRVENENSFTYEQDSTRRDFATKQGLSRAYVPEGKNYIEIVTDSVTGEFAVELPPLRYTTRSVNIPKQPELSFDKLTIDATTPGFTYTDSVETESGDKNYFSYHASAKYNYRAQPTLNIVENENGAYGADSVMVTDINGDTELIPAYEVKGDTIHYLYKYPLYEQSVGYSYDVTAFERYFNKDGKKEVEYDDPLANVTVTIKNEYAASTSLLLEDGSISEIKADTFKLDSAGHATYNFIAGLPNIQAPYTRSLNAAFDVDGATIQWGRKLEAVVLGGLTNGNDFTTAGPDQVLMVLRDPPGSLSRTVYSKGTEFTTRTTLSQKAAHKFGTSAVFKFGMTQIVEKGELVLIENWVKNVGEGETGFETTEVYSHSDTKSTTTTLTEQVATSSSPTFVGDKGDVFIGLSKNILIGSCRSVMLKKNETTGQYELTMQDQLSSGEKFTTNFNYTAWQIENNVMPKFISLRNALIKPVASIDSVRRPAKGQDPVYVSTLSPDDKRFGSDNDDRTVWGDAAVSITSMENGIYTGPSYTMILPDDYDKAVYQDMVKYYNTQVSLWKQELANNEMAKVTAIENKDEYLDKNYSFDAGSSMTVTHSSRNTHDASHSLQTDLNIFVGAGSMVETQQITVMGTGMKMSQAVTSGATEVWANTESETSSISYTLQDDQLGDYLSVDVFDAPDGFGPIFYTRGGATTNPFEDEVQTKYYEPGSVIAQKTLQVDKPEIEIVDPIVTGVPAGTAAVFHVKLRNNSETQKAVTYGLTVPPGKNPNGAQVYMDGRIVNNGITITLPYGETSKTFTLRQSNQDIMEYKNIPIRFYSTTQFSDASTYPGIYSDADVTVEFQPSCSNVALKASTAVVNNENKDQKLVLSVSGYDYNMASLRGVKLQYKGANDADFKTLQDWRKSAEEVAADSLNRKLLPMLTGGRVLTDTLDMTDRSFSDQTYVFRAITICNQNGVEVNNESEEISVTRDLSAPQLIATPTPASGILGPGDDISITFNEDIASGSLTLDGNFVVTGMLNERKVAHETALALESGAKAKTQATIDLTQQSFSVDTWLNYTQDGRLFYHGSRDYGLRADIVGGRLELGIGQDTLVSAETLPKDKWLYLHVNYDRTGETPYVSAYYAQDAQTVRLINHKPVPKERFGGCNGPLTLGGTTLVGKLQELAIWNAPRTMEEAQSTMYTTKNVFTDNLIGYWPLDEGHGLSAADKARARDLVLPAENAWWISAENYAATLDGNTALRANIASATTTASESYLLEGWFRADKEQAGQAAILSVGDSLLAVGLDADGGKLTLTAYGETKVMPTADLRDASWHHLAFNVLKDTKGSATVYLDGNPVRQLSASSVPALQSDALIIGGHRLRTDSGTYYNCFFKGAVDEIRLWKSRRTAEVIRETMYSRVRPDADGLIAYYPMEATHIDDNNQVVTAGLAADATGGAPTDMVAVAGSIGAERQVSFDDTSTPALTARKSLENVSFSFVASERTVKVNLQEAASRLEGCTVNITARDIRDVHGNRMQPVTWSVYVNQSRLKWSESAVSISKSAQETATRTVAVRNIGGETELYSILGTPDWLSISRPDGALKPLAEQELTFSVLPGLAIGNYDATIWLTGNQGIELPLHVNVKVEGQRPDWTADEAQDLMPVIGQFAVDGIVSSDTADLVAAFIGDRCVGVASPEYYDRYDAYIVLLAVYGNDADKGKPLTYKAYDASTGRIYPIVSASKDAAYTFRADTWVGVFKDPVVFTPDNLVQQDLSAAKAGWKWLSLYVKPKDSSLDALFGDAAGSIALVNNYTHSAQYNADFRVWDGNLDTLNASTMYKLDVTAPYSAYVNGQTIDPSDVPVTLNRQWSWIGYPVADVNTLDNAFADAQPQEGDILKGQIRFAMYVDGQWVGRLTAITPGEGYIYYSNADAVKTFRYPMVIRQNQVAPAFAAPVAAEEDKLLRGFRDNMTMVAVVSDGNNTLADATVDVYAGGTLRAHDRTDADGRLFLTIGGDSDTGLLTFVITTGTETKALRGKLSFQANAHYGSPAKPYVLQLADATGISTPAYGHDIVSVELYAASGALVRKSKDNALFTAADLSGLKAGVYLQRVTYADGTVETVKMTKK